MSRAQGGSRRIGAAGWAGAGFGYGVRGVACVPYGTSRSQGGASRPPRGLAWSQAGVAWEPRPRGWVAHAGGRRPPEGPRRPGVVHLTMGASGRRVPPCPPISYSCAPRKNGLRPGFRRVLRAKRALSPRSDFPPPAGDGVCISSIAVRGAAVSLSTPVPDVRNLQRVLPSPRRVVLRGRIVLRSAQHVLRDWRHEVRQIQKGVRGTGRRSLEEQLCPEWSRRL